MLDTFGKDADSLTNVVKGFCKVLEPYQLGDISSAFLDWIKTSSKMPAPADIAKLCDEMSVARSLPRGAPSLEDVRWTMGIYDWVTDGLIHEYPHGTHPSPLEIDKLHGPSTYRRMRRER